MVDDEGVKDKTVADSPVSVLEDEDTCKEELAVKLEEELIFDTENGDATRIPENMVKEEEILIRARAKQEEEQLNKLKEAPILNDTQFNKLDELLTQTQLYSEFLLEKMDNITTRNVVEDEEKSGKENKKGRGSKRKATTSYNNNKAKRAVAAMLTRSKEDVPIEDATLTEEERFEKEQAELVPLLTGGKLKSYQLKGVKWLISLWQNGLNGILADQMGLGKTIQTIAFLAHLKGNGLDGPYLIIAPLSTLSNWLNEIERFVPSINAIIYHGDKKQRDEIRMKHMPRTIGPKFPIVITSYEIAMSDARRFLRHYSWKYLVVDEGHRLKNSKCKLFKELKLLPIENKLLLTGTPLQNNLTELWSLLNFILPDIFSSHDEFESWFDLSGKFSNESEKEEMEERRRAQVVAKLHAILRPFLLRRLKVDVEQMLPRKKEIILYATLTDYQKKFQEHLINRTLEGYLIENVSTGNGFKGRLNNLMIQLRKNCNHPDLLESIFNGSNVYPPVEQIVEQCGKFRLLDRLLSKLFARKHKVLIFSQWTRVLDIMDYYFSERGFDVCRIDGSVKLDERKRQIKEFNDVSSKYRIFLLSTRAGGLGINLTAADTCILYDSDWNPQMDLQAMDRCHRIGQTKPVHVYRLSTALSVEGRILKRAFSKLKLEHVVIGKGQFQQERSKPSMDVKDVTETERRARIHKIRLEEGAKKAAEELEKYDPSSDPNVTGDPYKTLFVARLNYETTESRVKREFEAYGPIKRVRLVMDKTNNKPRGYAFIEYVHTRDMKAAYKQADGKKIDNRRVLVDVERGRTVPNWRPRRLGGGLGTTRVGNEDVNREVVQPGRAASRSEEPRARDDRDSRDREKSRERVRDKDREKSRERSHDRPRDRERDDKHHRERERTRDREKDRGRDRDRDRERDRTRDRERGKDRDRDRERDRHREKDRERGRDEGEVDQGRGRSRDREYDYEHVESKHERERHGDKERNYDHAAPEDDHGHYDYYDHHQGRGDYENPDAQGGDDRYKDASHGHDRYDQMEEDNYAYDHGATEAKERDRDYKRSDRSHSREYDY